MNLMIIISFVLLAISLGLGVRLAITSFPYGTAPLAVHKLSSVAFVALAAIVLLGGGRSASLMAAELTLLVALAAAFLALLITGGILSAKQPTPVLHAIHSVSAALLTIGVGWKLGALLIG